MSDYPWSSYGNAEGEPTRMQRRLGRQAAEGVPASTLLDFISNGGPMTFGPGFIEQANILGDVERGAALPAAYDLSFGPLDLGDLDFNSPAQHAVLATALRDYATTNPSGAHYRHRMGRGQSASAISLPLTMWDDSDLGVPVRFVDVRIGGFSIQAQSRQNLKLVVTNAVPGKFDVWGATTQTVGTGVTGTGLPLLRHMWAGNIVPSAFDADIYVKVIDAADGIVKVKMGSAETYDGREVTVDVGGWVYLYGTYDLSTVFPSGTLGDYPVTAADGSIGRRDEQIMLWVGDISGWADDDEFKIVKRLPRWTPSFPVQRLCAETQCRFFLEGGEVAFDNGWTLTMARQTAETRFAPGAGAQPIGSRVTGFQDVTLQVERRLVDNDLMVALQNRTLKPVVIEAIGDALIGATAERYGQLHVLPACRFSGLRYSTPAGGGDPVEQLTFTAGVPASAYSYGGLSFPGAYEIVSNTGIVTLT
jgi:hypothetical protein